ncbi:hypothetical protein [Gemmiger sp.]
MKTEREHSLEAENHLHTFVRQARWERCARHCQAMQQRYALCCEQTYFYGLDYSEVTELMELWLYWAALQDLYAMPDVCPGGAFAAASKKLEPFLDIGEAEAQRRKAADTYRAFRPE